MQEVSESIDHRQMHASSFLFAWITLRTLHVKNEVTRGLELTISNARSVGERAGGGGRTVAVMDGSIRIRVLLNQAGDSMHRMDR
jgi:hypothetical protein